MGRVIVMWIDPMHLSAAEAEAWVRAECGRMLELVEVDSLELIRLSRASEAHAQPWDWMLDVRLPAGVDSCVEEPAFAEWVRDLRLLGMRPVVLCAGDATVIGSERA
jgi:hypothetical protein